ALSGSGRDCLGRATAQAAYRGRARPSPERNGRRVGAFLRAAGRAKEPARNHRCRHAAAETTVRKPIFAVDRSPPAAARREVPGLRSPELRTSARDRAMQTVLVLHGPNLNLLGEREPEIYGRTTLAEIDASLVALGRELGVAVETFQSNHEGALIDRIQAARGTVGAIVINPGGLTHTSVAL